MPPSPTTSACQRACPPDSLSAFLLRHRPRILILPLPLLLVAKCHLCHRLGSPPSHVLSLALIMLLNLLFAARHLRFLRFSNSFISHHPPPPLHHAAGLCCSCKTLTATRMSPCARRTPTAAQRHFLHTHRPCSYLHRFLLHGARDGGSMTDEEIASHVLQLLQRGCSPNVLPRFTLGNVPGFMY